MPHLLTRPLICTSAKITAHVPGPVTATRVPLDPFETALAHLAIDAYLQHFMTSPKFEQRLPQNIRIDAHSGWLGESVFLLLKKSAEDGPYDHDYTPNDPQLIPTLETIFRLLFQSRQPKAGQVNTKLSIWAFPYDHNLSQHDRLTILALDAPGILSEWENSHHALTK